MFETRPHRSYPLASRSAPYPGRMTLSAHDVAAVLRDRLPGVPTKKLHKLLYYCQGHHLAAFDEPMFVETISAWDMGPVVGSLWHAEKTGEAPAQRVELNEAQLNTVGYVVSRYGALTGQDLENLTHSEPPWRTADSRRRPQESVRIESEWIKDYFRTAGSADEAEDEVLLDSVAVTRWLQGAESRRAEPATPDSPELVRARLQDRV
jgi:uncharacterized phage-associated protein